MDSKEFVQGLVDELETLFARLDDGEILEAESGGKKDVVTLLELAASWMPQTGEVDGKMLFALQCGDEMRHYGLIRDRLRELGHTVEIDPAAAVHATLAIADELKTLAEKSTGVDPLPVS